MIGAHRVGEPGLRRPRRMLQQERRGVLLMGTVEPYTRLIRHVMINATGRPREVEITLHTRARRCI